MFNINSPFFHIFKKLVRASCMPGTIQCPGDTAVKPSKVPTPS